VVALLGLPLVLFAVFLVGRAAAPAPPRHPVVLGRIVSGVKPDAVYTQASLPAAEPAQPGSNPADAIIYFAPADAQLPVLVSVDEPSYPRAGLPEGCQPTVLLKIKIDAQGMPKDPALRQESGCGLDLQALRAVMNWRFRPAQLNGKAVGVGAWVEVRFRSS
jgi:protein TonB